MAKNSLYEERAELIDAQFLGELSAEGVARLGEIEAEFDRLEAPRVVEARQRRAAETAPIDRQIADLKAKIKKKNASRRPQAKTAGSH